MIGCFAEALSEDITIDEKELADARWFTRDEIILMIERAETQETPRIAPPMAIAHQLVKAWIEES